MFFYIDESGHTGAHLFDPDQPTLYYGVLSSGVNLDFVAESKLARLRAKLGVDRLHASQLGNRKLATIASGLIDLQKRFKLRFDIFRVMKPDHAVICFFDQVFDAGNNPAISWTGYWSPLRYALLLQVAELFDEELAKLAWAARIETNDAVALPALQAVCRELVTRLPSIGDERARELIGDTLAWAIANPGELSYNAQDKEQILQMTPNIIGFQLVMHGIASRVRTLGGAASKIVVDQQKQFNKSQNTLSKFFASAAGMVLPMGLSMPSVNFNGMPTVPIEFKSGTESAGLELVDVYLWIFKRAMEDQDIAQELYPLFNGQLRRGRTDEVSLAAIAKRWNDWNDNAPPVEEMSGEQIARGRELLFRDETRRRAAVRQLGHVSDADPE